MNLVSRISIPVVLAACVFSLAAAYLSYTRVPLEADGPLYASILSHMDNGADYYTAHQSAYQYPISQTRSVRLPTTSWLLSAVPATTRIWVSGLFTLATFLLVAWLVGPSLPRQFLAVCLLACWVLAAATVSGRWVYPETFAAPFSLVAWGQMRRGRSGAGWWLAAALFRELFALGLILGCIRGLWKTRHRWGYWIGAGIFALAYLFHSYAASNILANTGYEAAFGRMGYSWHVMATMVSPGSWWGCWIIGVGVVGIGLHRAWRIDRFMFWYMATLAGLAIWSTRFYWQATFIPMAIVLAVGIAERRKEMELDARVEVGQVWESRDKRDEVVGGHRQFRVTEIRDTHALVYNLYSRRHSRIRLERFRGTDAKGYRLVADVETRSTGEAVADMLNASVERALG